MVVYAISLPYGRASSLGSLLRTLRYLAEYVWLPVKGSKSEASVGAGSLAFLLRPFFMPSLRMV